MKVEPTALPGVLLIKPPVHGDARGFFQETWAEARYREAGVDVTFVQDNHSRSRRGVLRGLHYQLQRPQAKLVWVARGEVLDVAVDIRKGSPTFGQHVTARLTELGGEQLFIPAGFAHGFVVLSEEADFCYKCSDYYSGAADQLGVLWSDPALGINWELEDVQLSEKDRQAPRLKDVPDEKLPRYEG